MCTSFFPPFTVQVTGWLLTVLSCCSSSSVTHSSLWSRTNSSQNIPGSSRGMSLSLSPVEQVNDVVIYLCWIPIGLKSPDANCLQRSDQKLKDWFYMTLLKKIWYLIDSFFELNGGHFCNFVVLLSIYIFFFKRKA